MHYDVAVVGAGAAGLTAGGILARRGRRVVVCERARAVGGRATVVQRRGFTLDHGMHFARFCGHGRLAKAMTALGATVEFAVLGQAWLWTDGELAPLSPSGAARPSLRFLRAETFGALRTYAEFGGSLALPADPRKSLAQLLDEIHAGDDVRRVADLFALSAFVALSPADVASTEARAFLRRAVINHVSGGKQAGYPRGGWRPLFAAAQAQLERSGELRLGVPARRIALRRGQAVGVETDRGLVRAGAVIAAVPGQRLHRLLDVAALGPEWPRRLRRITPTAGLSLDLCLGRRVADMTGLVLSLAPPLFAAFPSNLEPSLAPPGKQLATFFSPLPAGRIRDRRLLAQREADVRQAAEAMFPGIGAAVERERRLVLPMVDGALPMVGQAAEDRPPCQSPIPGLFFAGDWTNGHGAGSDIAFHSAVMAADLVDAYLGGA